MKKLFAICLLGCLTARAAAPVRTTISSLPQITAPSTNTYFEVADMSATPKSRKLSITDLKSSLNATNVDGSGTANTLAKWADTNTLTSLPNGTEGYILSISNGVPTYVPVVFTNATVQSNFFAVGKGGHLTITNNITIQTNGSLTLSNLPAPSVLVLGTNRNVTNATLSGLTLGNDNTLTATGGGGASTWIPNATLTYSGGTNVTIDGSGGTNFVLNVTNTTFFATPNNVPGGTGTNTSFTVFFKMNSTGAWGVTWTNGSFKFPAAAQFQPDTNANAVSWVTFTMSPFTNGIFMGDYGVLGNR